VVAEGAALPLRGVSGGRVALGLALLAVATPAVAVLLFDRVGVDAEIVLIAPDAARPGDTLPLRVLLYRDLDAPGGPSLATAPVRVELRAGDVPLRIGHLGAGAVPGAEGAIEVPSAPGVRPLSVVAMAEGFGEVARPLRIATSPPAAPREPLPLGALTELRVGRDAVRLRIVGGACVPETPCQVLVDPAETRSIAVRPSSSVRPLPSPPGALGVEVHGPEGATELEVGGEIVSLQLPVMLGVPGLRVDRRDAAAPRPRLETVVLTEGRPVIVDAFHEGRWAQTWSFEGGGVRRWGGDADLVEGDWVLQARASLFDTRRVLPVALRVTGDRSDAARPPEWFARAPTAWSLAAREREIRRLPEPVSSLPAAREALVTRRGQLRAAAAAALVLGILLAAVAFLRRAIRSAETARRVLDASHVAAGEASLAPTRRRALLLDALGLALLAILALVAGAALLVVRAMAP
jgi:hypothetical protein